MRTEALSGAGGEVAVAGCGDCCCVGVRGKCWCDCGVEEAADESEEELATMARSAWTGSTCWAVWLKKRRDVVVAVTVAGVVFGRMDGARRATRGRSSSTERSSVLLIAGRAAAVAQLSL